MPTKDDPCRIVHGDCASVLRTMPDKSVDCVVTSPPYNQTSDVNMPPSRLGGGRNVLVKGEKYEDDMEERVYQGWLSSVVAECLRVCRGLVWVNHKVRYRQKTAIHPLQFLRFPVYCEVIWDRCGSTVFRSQRFSPSHEQIYAFGMPCYWDSSVDGMQTVWRIPPERGSASFKEHPCPFPLTIPLRCIRASCPDDGVVLDPFAGSGTTGQAALEEGCRAVLIEKDEKYIPVIRKRIRGVLSDNLMPRRAFRKSADSEETIF